MSKHRKCDTTKYKKRHVKDKVAHARRVERRKKEEAVRERILYEQHEKARMIRKGQIPLVKRMVDLLARVVCERDNRYYGALKVRELFQITSVFGLNPNPPFPTLPEIPRETTLESDKVIDGEVIKR